MFTVPVLFPVCRYSAVSLVVKKHSYKFYLPVMVQKKAWLKQRSGKYLCTRTHLPPAGEPETPVKSPKGIKEPSWNWAISGVGLSPRRPAQPVTLTASQRRKRSESSSMPNQLLASKQEKDRTEK